MKKYYFEQGSTEWFKARLGIPTASEFDKIITPTGKSSTQADAYANQLIAEMMVGESIETWDGSVWTQRGKELEPEAAAFYEQMNSEPLEKIGFVTDDGNTKGCSPDRFVGVNGMLEIKIPAPKNHVNYLLKESVDKDHFPQIMGQLDIGEREWVDTLSFHPKMPPVLIRSWRNEPFIKELRRLLDEFNDRLAEKKAIMIQKGHMK